MMVGCRERRGFHGTILIYWTPGGRECTDMIPPIPAAVTGVRVSMKNSHWFGGEKWRGTSGYALNHISKWRQGYAWLL